MSWHALAAGISTAIEADTGAGGLRLSSSAAYVTGAYNVEAQQGATYPYLVYFPVTQTEFDQFTSGNNVQIDFDVAIFVAKTAGPASAATIANRVRTVLHRVAVTALDGSGWTCRPLIRTGAVGPMFDDHNIQLNESYRAVLVS